MDTLNLLKTLIRMDSAEQYNRFLNWLQKWIIIGKKIPNRWYRADELKGFLLVMKCLLFPISLVWRSVAYALFCHFSGLALSTYLSEQFHLERSANDLALLLMIVFSVLLFPVIDMALIDKGDVDTAKAVRMFHIKPLHYVIAREILTLCKGVVARTLVLGIYFSSLGLPFWNGLTFALGLAGLRLGLKVLFLPIYHCYKGDPDDFFVKAKVSGLIIAFILGIMLFFQGEQFPISALFGLQMGIIGGLLWWLSFHQLKGQTFLNRLMRSYVTHDSMKEAATATENIEKAAVEVATEEVEVDRTQQVDEHLHGVGYLNALFMRRLGKHLQKGVQLRVRILLGLSVMVVIGRVFLTPEQPVEADGKLLIRLLMLGYLFYIGESYVKFCFYHLDRPLLKYHFYRRRDVVLQTLLERFGIALKHNVPILLSTIAFLSLLYLLYFEWTFVGLGLIVLGQLLSMAFFSLYFLYLYFLLQPFTTSMEVTSKTYKVLRGVMYYGGYQLTRLVDGSPIIILVLLSSLVIFVVAGFFAVLRFAPKTFRIKD